MWLHVPLLPTILWVLLLSWQINGEIIELNHESLSSKSHTWPAEPKADPFVLKRLKQAQMPQGYWFETNQFCSPEHVGTHLDAPVHFARNAWTLDEIPPERLIAPAVVIDIRDKVKKNALYRLTARDVTQWVEQNGNLPNNSVVLVHTGWSKRYGNKLSYFGHQSDPSKFIFPGISKEAAETLLNYRQVSDIHIVGVGIDTPSIDFRQETNNAHVVLSKANIYILEDLANLEKVPMHIPELISMPLKIKDASGSPCRVLARTSLKENCDCNSADQITQNSIPFIMLFTSIILNFI